MGSGALPRLRRLGLVCLWRRLREDFINPPKYPQKTLKYPPKYAKFPQKPLKYPPKYVKFPQKPTQISQIFAQISHLRVNPIHPDKNPIKRHKSLPGMSG